MRLRTTLVVRAASVSLLIGTLVFVVTIRGHAGAEINNVPFASPSLLPEATSLLPSTAGGRIAFAQDREIFLINPDGTGLTQLTHSGPGVFNFQPALSPDGMRVAFGRVEGSTGGISIVDVDGSGLRSLTTNQTSYDSEPAWSPDGSTIAFVRGFDPTAEGVANFSDCDPAEIYLVSVDSVDSLIINLTPGKNSTDPSWSPDGQRIAFASNRANGESVANYDIYAVTIESGEVEQLTQTPEQEAEPVWSPDGKQIAYARDYSRAELPCGWEHTPGRPPDFPPLGGQDIYLMSSDGNNQNRLTETQHNIEPTWSPDGTSLAFVRFSSGATQVCVRDISQKAEYTITSESNHKFSPSWSRADPRLPIDGK